jgi:hypothetical protein
MAMGGPCGRLRRACEPYELRAYLRRLLVLSLRAAVVKAMGEPCGRLRLAGEHNSSRGGCLRIQEEVLLAER